MEQFDTLLPELTVREMLLYTAELKCARAEPLAAKRACVETLLGTLALGGCAGTLIGDALARGISGGQVSARSRAAPPVPMRYADAPVCDPASSHVMSWSAVQC